jgi:hypothetical protein
MKRSLIVLASLCVAALVVRIVEAPLQGQGQGNGGSSEVQAGRGAVPPEITLNLAGKNPSRVYEGSYYVNGVSDCTGCHNGPETDESGAPIPLEERYLAGGQNFGPVFTRNLTPDANGLPAGLTFEQFVQVIRQGRDFKELPPIVGNPDTLIVMPWPAYRHGTDRFIRALYEYLKAVPCLPGGPLEDSATRCDE